ncbi:MAG: protein kinase [Acidobacteriota bacterium]
METPSNPSWQRLRDLADQALGLPPEQRGDFLHRASDSPEERRVLESLLQVVEGTIGVDPDSTRVLSPAPPPARSGPQDEPQRLGPYRILGELGHGGMGTVYLAERADGEFDQTVALKVVGRGFVTQEMRRRFLAERQILARLSHPNVARLLDGGTGDTGVPYLVMEHIEGEPINVYAEASGLGPEARIRLMLQVCSAVEFAHRNLVVHRDLKPSNILVEVDGTVKLLDFGIAKLLGPEDGGGHTQAGQLLMTPRYASPEQMVGDTVTTLSDVYSLGVVLYELVAGRLPHGHETASELALMREVVHGDEPPPPSRALAEQTSVTSGPWGRWLGALRPSPAHSAVRALEGDIDRIVMKALEKEPTDRYGSAAELADDLERHLNHEPVRAAPASTGYRIRKFVRRRRGTVAAVVLLLLSLTAGFVARSLEARRAQAARAEAEAARDRAETLANFMLQDLWEKLSPIGRLDLLGPVAEQVHAYYADQKVRELSPEVQLNHAEALDAVAAVLHEGGDVAGAEATYRELLDRLERVSDAPSLDIDFLELYTRLSLAGTLRDQAKLSDALELYRRSVDRIEQLEATWGARGELTDEDTNELVMLQTDALDSAGVVLYGQGRLEEAHGKFRAADERLRRHLDGGEIPPDLAATAGGVALHLGVVLEDLGDPAGALPHLDRAVELAEQTEDAAPQDPMYAITRALPLTSRAGVLRKLGRTAEGEAALAPILDLLRGALERDTGNAEVALQLSSGLLEMAECRLASGDPEGRRRLLEEVIDLSAPFAETFDFSYLIDNRVRALLALGRTAEAHPPALALLGRGWNPNGFVELCRSHGIELEKGAPDEDPRGHGAPQDNDSEE